MTRAPLPPFVHKILCGRIFRQLRERAELNQEDIAKACHVSQPQVALIENGGVGTKLAQMETKLRPLLQPTDEDWDRLLQHERLGSERIPKKSFRFKFRGEAMRKVVDMESSASLIRCHNSMTIPGLLQTEAYMRNNMGKLRPAYPPEEIDRLVALRLRRQQVLSNLDQRFVFIIDQAALSRMTNMAGSTSGIMHEQLVHLLEVAERPNIELRFVPFSHGNYLGQEEDYRIFEYDEDPLVQVVSVERYDDLEVRPDTKNVEKYLTLWSEQVQAALDPGQARPFITFLTGPQWPS